MISTVFLSSPPVLRQQAYRFCSRPTAFLLYHLFPALSTKKATVIFAAFYTLCHYMIFIYQKPQNITHIGVKNLLPDIALPARTTAIAAGVNIIFKAFILYFPFTLIIFIVPSSVTPSGGVSGRSSFLRRISRSESCTVP